MILNISFSKYIIIILPLNQVFSLKIDYGLLILFQCLFLFFVVNDVSGMRLYSTLDYRPTEFGVLISR
jgi:hypothetical protein